MTGNGSRLMVERVDTVSRRPWIFVTGRLEGESLRIGDTVTIGSADQPGVRTIIRSIEIHSPPGKTTIALDASLKSAIQVGAVISRSA